MRSAEIDFSESTLIIQAQNGDNDAWTILVQRYQEPLFRLAYLRLGDAAEAENITQEGFIQAYRSLDRFDSGRPFKPWLFQIVINLTRNRQRSLGRYWAALQRWMAQQPTAETPSLSQQLDAERLHSAVKRLKSDFQEIVYLRYFLDLSVAETAEALQIAPGTVKSRSARALQQLQTIIEHEFEDLIR